MHTRALEEAVRAAARAADLARAETLSRFRSVAVETKADGSPVTEADRAAEEVIREALRETHPDFGVVGEEFGDERAPHDEGRPWTRRSNSSGYIRNWQLWAWGKAAAQPCNTRWLVWSL